MKDGDSNKLLERRELHLSWEETQVHKFREENLSLACVVDQDVPNLDTAADRIVFGAFYQSGQSCISVQRVYVHEKIYDSLKNKLIERTKKLTKGNPHDPNTFLGPLIRYFSK